MIKAVPSLRTIGSFAEGTTFISLFRAGESMLGRIGNHIGHHLGLG